ncbi:copper-binding protein [Bradyrhizobium liaoningense]|uniref:copper-binding protein n=1 Tax=Bradyrhizobium liaoningense TaxID=43992 RepID=UPI001BA91506|nr:copper-binding protein [Bradyrhizobium liaoningense]MBR0715012.1 copper-binding protein [Bradyrhizobium liaoningense]
MGTRQLIFAGAAAMGMLASSAFAADDMTGMVTRIDRLNSTISIQQMQSGTVGASGGGAVQEFKAKDAGMLEPVHVGDRVSYSATEAGGTKTITKLQKAK